MKTVKFFVIVALFASFSFLIGCSKGKIAKPSDIEIKIITKSANLFQRSFGTSTYFSDVAYEGSVINTGEGMAPLVKVKISWVLKNLGGLDATYNNAFGASNEEVFKNLRPGETRQISGIMKVRALVSGKSEEDFNYMGGLPQEYSQGGVCTYNVDVLLQ